MKKSRQCNLFSHLIIVHMSMSVVLLCSFFILCGRDDRRTAGYGHDSAAVGYGSYASSWPHDSYGSQHAYGNHGNNQR